MDTQGTMAEARAAGRIPAPFGYCILCGRAIYTAFVKLPAVRSGRSQIIYTARAHVACADLRAAGLTGDALTAARAALDDAQTAIETFYAGLVAAGKAVTR